MASSRVWTMADSGTFRPIFAWRPEFLAVLGLLDDRDVGASSSTPYFSRMPLSATLIAVLRAVWPPRVGRRASGAPFR
jgi:hypothetical protein